jgi:uncharacterized protein YybS (DUF2232 family)
MYDREYLRGLALSTALLTLPALAVGLAWLFFLAPLPLIYFPIALGFDKGFRIVFHATLISAGIALLTGTFPVLLCSLSLLPTGFMVARSLNRKESIQNAFSKGTLTLGLIWLLSGTLIGASNHINLYQEVLVQIDAGLSSAYDTYSKQPDVPLDTQVELQAAFTRIREVTPKIFPGILATITFSTVWFNIILANWLLKRNGHSGWGDMSQWRLPDPLVWVFIAGGVSLFLPGTMNTIGLNLLIIMVTLYFMQGYEVFNHLCLKWSVPKLMRVLLMFFLVIQAYGFILLALLGLADIWADFRKPKMIDTE